MRSTRGDYLDCDRARDMILLSHDITFLSPVRGLIMRLWYPKHLNAFTATLRNQLILFHQKLLGPWMPEKIATFEGRDAKLC